MQWVYLSPHLDDVALSCGGLIWEQTQSGDRVLILTICAGDPPPGGYSPFAESLHLRWETGILAMEQRRQEDRQAAQILGASVQHLEIQDCIYRMGEAQDEHLYPSEESLFGPVHPAERGLVDRLKQILARNVPDESQLVCPITLGGHVDHKLTRSAAEKLSQAMWYYADYPYAQKDPQLLAQYQSEGWRWQLYPVSADGLCAWQEAIAAHASQISTFWPNLDAMRTDILVYLQLHDGIRLWRKPKRENKHV